MSFWLGFAIGGIGGVIIGALALVIVLVLTFRVVS